MYKQIILLILFEIGFGITLNIVGVISLSEIFLLLYSVRLLFTFKTLIKDDNLKKISFIYLLLFISQILSEVVVGNSLDNSLKGLAVTLMSFLHLVYLYANLRKNPKLILYLVIGFALRYLIFGVDNSDEVSSDQVLDGEAAGFVKTYLVNLVFPLLLGLSIVLKNRKHAALLIAFAGLLFVVLGARNSGATLAAGGAISYIVMISGAVSKQRIIVLGLVSIALSYAMYFTYVNKVLEGEIDSGNSYQIRKLTNPYNPLNLLMMGRAETFVGWVAFMDRPYFGHGSWPTDNSGKYNYILSQLHKDYDHTRSSPLIPSHSIIVGIAMQNGILSFLLVVLLIYYVIKSGAQCLKKNERYLIIIVYGIFYILWNSLFSPVSHLRYTLPLYFAIIYTINWRQKRFKEVS